MRWCSLPCLDGAEAADEAFRRFFALRQERTQTVIKMGRMAGSQKQAQSWLELRMRDLILPMVMPMGGKAQERMFRFRADQTPLAQPMQ